MANTNFQSIDEYIGSQPISVRPVLEQVRDVIRKALPGAVETISYQLPAFKIDGRLVIWFAGWKKHYALYPGARAPEVFAKELEPYELSKGTVRFPLDKPVPVKLITRLAKFRAQEAAEQAKKQAK